MQNEGNCLLEEYVGKILGLTLYKKGSGSDLVKGLPIYLKGAFDFSLIEIEGQDFLLLTPSTEVDLTTMRTVKFANQISMQTGKLTLLQFKSMDNIRRRTLIGHRENFVVPGKQIYIPSLRMQLNERGKIQQLVVKRILTPSSQCLLLYHLQNKSLEGIPLKDIVEKLRYSKKTISIVTAELQHLSICEVEQVNKRSKVLLFNKNGRDLWDSVLPLMSSPVHKVLYIEKKHLPENLPLYTSYNMALAHYTFMADTSLASYAVDRKVFSEYQDKLQAFLHPEEGNVRLEVWKYNPALLTAEKFVDKLSLMLCYKDTDDERIRKELTKMINNIIW
jgi:hypothetical protein